MQMGPLQMLCSLEMIGNGFLHSHSFPFQFPNNRSIVAAFLVYQKVYKDSANIQYHNSTELVTESNSFY